MFPSYDPPAEIQELYDKTKDSLIISW
jgi:hypothetical protein